MRTLRALVGGIVVAASCATAWVLACGPFTFDMLPVTAVFPAEPQAYAAGNLGVVRPRFARHYLLLAYRVLNGQPNSARLGEPYLITARTLEADRPAAEMHRELLADSQHPFFSQYKLGPNYSSIRNCGDDALATALRTRHARVEKFGASSPEVLAWTRGQAAVFENCSGRDLVLPPDLPPGIDPLIRADRAYQTAAAFFYAMQYEEAVKRFSAIAADASSPWRHYGRYLAARSKIRQGTVFDENKALSAKLLAEATADLNDVLRDNEAAALHESARGLLDFVKARTQPIDRLRELAATLTGKAEPPAAAVFDYVLVMNRLVGDTVNWDYGGLPDAQTIAATSDLNDWVLAMQGSGNAASERALARWKATKTLPWLVAALWKVSPSNAVAVELLEAAKHVEASSPAYPTVAFLRVRLLAQRGDRAAAEALLATLPVQPQQGFSRESINLLRAERLMFAESLDEVLVNAPRFVPDEHPGGRLDKPIFDEDGAAIFDHRLPLRRLVDASASDALPPRLRLKVALATFARSVVLRPEEDGMAVARVLRELTSDLAPDLDAYLHAETRDDRHRAAIILLLRTPGVIGRLKRFEDTADLERDQPARTFDHLLRRNWWCAPYTSDGEVRQVAAESLYGREPIPFPAFVTAEERAVATQELAAFDAVGAARKFLATEAVAWARARPGDPLAAEALALSVEGWRWSCGYDETWPIVRTAFHTLHRQFPNSEWARRTKYWYK